MKSLYAFLTALALILVSAGCHHTPKPAVATAPPAQPKPAEPSASLTVTPDNVQRGQSAELHWNTQNAFTVTIDGVGTVSASGSQRITPSDSTTYHLQAKGDGGSADASAHITVNVPPVKAAELTEEQLFERNVKDIFFSYDKADIRADEQSLVAADAQFLSAHPAMKLVLEGHCDERGSEDYNMALGQSRADQVKNSLVAQGVSADRIKLISYGKEKPFCTLAENESCWQQNRRAHFVLQSRQQASAQ